MKFIQNRSKYEKYIFFFFAHKTLKIVFLSLALNSLIFWLIKIIKKEQCEKK